MALGFAAVGTLLVLVVPEIALRQGPVAEPAWLSVLLVLVAAAGHTQRRVRPLVALGVATAVLVGGAVAVGVTPLGVALVFGETLYAAVLFTPRRTSRAVVGAVAAAATALALGSASTDGWRTGLHVLLNLGLLLAVPVVWAQEVRGHRERADAERARAEAVARVAELDRAAAVTAERTRMARDLHDVVAGQLSAIALQSEAVLARPTPTPPCCAACSGRCGVAASPRWPRCAR
jgi:signal transduction histidine kinase